MLILSRQEKEEIYFTLSREALLTLAEGVEIKFTLLSIHGKRVRVSIEAPREVEIARGEIHKKEEKK